MLKIMGVNRTRIEGVNTKLTQRQRALLLCLAWETALFGGIAIDPLSEKFFPGLELRLARYRVNTTMSNLRSYGVEITRDSKHYSIPLASYDVLEFFEQVKDPNCNDWMKETIQLHPKQNAAWLKPARKHFGERVAQALVQKAQAAQTAADAVGLLYQAMDYNPYDVNIYEHLRQIRGY